MRKDSLPDSRNSPGGSFRSGLWTKSVIGEPSQRRRTALASASGRAEFTARKSGDRFYAFAPRNEESVRGASSHRGTVAEKARWRADEFARVSLRTSLSREKWFARGTTSRRRPIEV
eukprot:15221735-Alexandrium_andersonii.AAC.1